MEPFRMCFDNTLGSYLPGEMISGAFVVDLKERIEFRELVVTFSGNGYCHWSRGTREDQTTYRNKEKYFKEDCVLIEASPQRNNSLGPGVSSFRFRFQLPENIPPSFSFNEYGDIAKVTYSVNIAFKEVKGSAKSADINKKCEFGVKSFQFDSNFIPNLPEAADAKMEKYVCCLCCQAGPVILCLRLNKDVYNAGMTIVFDVELNNKATTRTLGKVEVKLVKLVVLLDGKGNKAKHRYPTSSIVLAQTIFPGGEEYWHNVLLHTPSHLEPTIENSLCVNLTYSLVVKVKIPSGITAKVKLPVRVLPWIPTTLPPYASPHQQSSSYPVVTQPISYEPPPPYSPNNISSAETPV